MDPNTKAMEGANGARDRPPAPEGYDLTSGTRKIRPAIVIEKTIAGDLNILLALLVALMLACGVAAGVTVNFAHAYADDSRAGY